MNLNLFKTRKLNAQILLLGLLFSVINPNKNWAINIDIVTFIDEEYDRYKKKADDYFKKGDYVNAKKQYKNCLVVPGFENDNYANKRVILADDCLKIAEKAEIQMKSNNPEEGINLLEQILGKNPEDTETKSKIATYFKTIANNYYNTEKYKEAIIKYNQALKYDNDKSTLAILIKNCEEKITAETKKVTETPKVVTNIPKPEIVKVPNEIKNNKNIQLFAQTIKIANTKYVMHKYKKAQKYYEEASKIAKNCIECKIFSDKLDIKIENINHNIEVEKYKDWKIENIGLIFFGISGVSAYGYEYMRYKKVYNDVVAKKKLADPLPFSSQAYANYIQSNNNLIEIVNNNPFYNGILITGVSFGTFYLIRKIIGKKKPENLNIIPFEKGISLSYKF
jgi:tetratricopeptide (TPR) repeat protein